MDVAVYLRVSTEEQRERQSIDTQRNFAERYCILHNLTITHMYADDGISGTIPLLERPAGSQILRDLREKPIDQLLAYKLDRFGRDARLILNAVADFEKRGVRVRSMTEEFDTGTAAGRLMLTLLSGFAAHERDMIRERSIAGSNRLAQAGAWTGGIVPFGYRKEGIGRNARLVPSEEPIPGLDRSEADIMRMMFSLMGEHKQTCYQIADSLNALGVPCAYVRDGRLLARGKRKAHTSGLWRPARIRNLIISSTYMGRHEYGKRSVNPNRELIVRQVPALVGEELWRKAQTVLTSNFLFGKRNASHQYLLRGITKCGLCGLTYIGLANKRPSGKTEFYYRCNGKHGARGLYGAKGERCPSKDVNGDFMEGVIWHDVEGFLRNPGEVIERLRSKMAAEREVSRWSKGQMDRIENEVAQKGQERDRILALFRRGRIDEAALDRQLDQIQHEESALRSRIAVAKAALQGLENEASQLYSASELLQTLRSRLDEPMSWELKRKLIEVLVGAIRVDTKQVNGNKEVSITVTYHFGGSLETCMGTDSLQPPA